MNEVHSVGVGEALRRERESRGLSLEEVAEAIKLSPRQIAAIEHEDLAALRGATYFRGFVRNYARALQIDAAPLMAALDECLGEQRVELAPISNADGAMPSAGAGARVPRPLAILALLAIGALVVVVYFERFRPPPVPAEQALAPPAPLRPADPPFAAVPSPAPEAPAVAANDNPAMPSANAAAAPAAEPVPAETAVPPAALAPESSAAAAPPATRLALRFAADSWVEVRDAQDRIVSTGLHRGGTDAVIEGLPPLRLVIGNAQQVQLERDGQPVDLTPHIKVSVARLTLQ